MGDRYEIPIYLRKQLHRTSSNGFEPPHRLDGAIHERQRPDRKDAQLDFEVDQPQALGPRRERTLWNYSQRHWRLDGSSLFVVESEWSDRYHPQKHEEPEESGCLLDR